MTQLSLTAVSDFRTIPHALFSLIAPDDCRLCGSPLEGWTRVPVCEPCLNSVVPLATDCACARCRAPVVNEFSLDPQGRCHVCRGEEPGFHEAFAFGLYEGALRDLIHLFKYERMRPLSRRFGRLLDSALPEGRMFDLIVPVPMHWRRRWHRGFNQCALLAANVGRRRVIPVAQPIRRVRHTSSQTGLTDDQRRRNVAAAFQVINGSTVDGQRILLVDDVMTTGATASACASVLRRAGARSVTLLTLARVDRRYSHPAGNYAMAGLVSR